MYVVQSCAVDVDPDTWRNIGEELTTADLKKIGSKRLKAMLTTRRVVEIEVVSPEPPAEALKPTPTISIEPLKIKLAKPAKEKKEG